MGYVVGGRCIADQQEAADVYYGSVSVTSWGDAAGLYQAYYQYRTDLGSPSGWIYAVDHYDPSGAWLGGNTILLSYPSFPVCDPSAPFVDGMTVGWLIAAAMCAAAAISFLKKAR